MEFTINTLYHIHNQGNNKEIIFKERKDYLLFISKMQALVKPNCDILSYCLMPNHFHFIVQTNAQSIEKLKSGSLQLTKLTNGIRLLLSEYAQEFNKRNKRSGSLFRQKTKYKLIDNGDPQYPKRVLHYVLSNPIEAKLVSNLRSWEFSSFLDLLGDRAGTLCDVVMCKKIFQYGQTDLEDIGAGYDDILYLKD
jgi:putative transposase